MPHTFLVIMLRLINSPFVTAIRLLGTYCLLRMCHVLDLPLQEEGKQKTSRQSVVRHRKPPVYILSQGLKPCSLTRSALCSTEYWYSSMTLILAEGPGPVLTSASMTLLW